MIYNRPIVKGTTNVSVLIRILNDDGSPNDTVTDATAGLDLKYRRNGEVTANLTETDLSALNDAHTDGGILLIGNGYYRIDPPDAAFATGADSVVIIGTATDMVVIGCYVPLVDAGDSELLTLINRIGAFTGTGVNTVLGFFKALFNSDASLPSDIGGDYDPATMSLEAFDATAMGASDIRDSVGLAAADLDTQLGALPTNAELATALGTADDAVLAAIAAIRMKKNVAFTNFPFEMRLTNGSLAVDVTPTCTIAGDNGNFAAISASPVQKTDGGSGTGCWRIDLAQAECNFDKATFKATGPGCLETVIQIIFQP